MKLFICLIILVVTLVSLSLSKSIAQAQAKTEMVLTWQANNYYPSDFKGKALATPRTPLTVSLEAVSNNKILDVSQANFVWYVDEQLFTRGVGQKEILLTVRKPEGGFHFVRVIIELGNELIESTLTIPVSSRSAVIDIPYPNQLVRAGEVLLQAIPYFFNVTSLKELDFTWRIDDKTLRNTGDNQIRLTVNTSQPAIQKEIQILSAVRSSVNPLEFTNARAKLTVL